jgi:hypothetical protein
VPKAPKVGPTVSRSSLSRPSKMDTWRAIRLPAFSPIAISKRKEQLPHIPDARSATRVSRTWGPQHHRVSSGPSDLEGRVAPIKPSRRFAHRDFKKQGSAPSYSRTPKAPLRISTGSQPVVTWERKELCKRGQRRRVQSQKDHRDLQVPFDPTSILVFAWSK